MTCGYELYFNAVNNFTSSDGEGTSELWKTDGTTVTKVWDGIGEGYYITLLLWESTINKLLVFVVDHQYFDNNYIYEFDPTDNSCILVLTYNPLIIDVNVATSYCYYNNKLFILHSSNNYGPPYLISYNPTTHTISDYELFPTYIGILIDALGGINFIDNWLYICDGRKVYRSATGLAGSWVLHKDLETLNTYIYTYVSSLLKFDLNNEIYFCCQGPVHADHIREYWNAVALDNTGTYTIKYQYLHSYYQPLANMYMHTDTSGNQLQPRFFSWGYYGYFGVPDDVSPHVFTRLPDDSWIPIDKLPDAMQTTYTGGYIRPHGTISWNGVLYSLFEWRDDLFRYRFDLLKSDGVNWTVINSFTEYGSVPFYDGLNCLEFVPGNVIPSYCTPLDPIMQARYEVNLYDTTGKLIAKIDNPKNIEIEHTVNSYSTHIVNIDNLDIRSDLFNLDYLVQVRRKLYNRDWYQEYIGFHRTAQRQITGGRHHIFTSYGRGLLDLVNRRVVAYPEVTPYTLKGGPGETVIKEYVFENASCGAENPVRWNPRGSIGLGVEPTLARGYYWAGQNSGKNLLEVIQGIASITSIDFDVYWIEGSGNFVFMCYYPQRGTDRRSYVAFDPDLGNMITPSYTYSRTEEASVCVVMGSGKSLNRRHLVRTSLFTKDSPWNTIEIIKDARNTDSVASYISTGDEALADASPKETFTFEVLQTAASQYGQDYFIGDIVTVRFADIERVKKITGANIQMKEGKEKIRLEFSDLPIFR